MISCVSTVFFQIETSSDLFTRHPHNLIRTSREPSCYTITYSIAMRRTHPLHVQGAYLHNRGVLLSIFFAVDVVAQENDVPPSRRMCVDDTLLHDALDLSMAMTGV